MNQRHSLFLPLIVLAFPTAARGGEDLLDLVRTGHRAAIESMRTFHCRYVAKITDLNRDRRFPRLDEEEVGEYWRSMDAIRIRSHKRMRDLSDEILVADAKIRKLSDQRKDLPGRRGSAGVGAFVTPYPQRHDGDVWFLALIHLTLVGVPQRPLSLTELLEAPHEVHQIKRVTEEGRELVYLDFSDDQSRFELWFDPATNYLIRKKVVHLRFHSAQWWRDVVVRFKETAPAIYFPEHVVREQYYGDKLNLKTVIAFTDIQVNQSLPTGTFQLRFPHGVVVQDSIQGKYYRADAEGREIGPAFDENGKVMVFNQERPLPAGYPSDGPFTSTPHEPGSWTAWILPASLTVLALAGALWWLRRRRSASG